MDAWTMIVSAAAARRRGRGAAPRERRRIAAEGADSRPDGAGNARIARIGASLRGIAPRRRREAVRNPA
jgi:hypothetical protein